MKYNVMGLLKNAAAEVNRTDGGTAYALLELANNLRLLMRGEDSLEEFKRCYTGHDAEPINIDALLPVST